VGLCLQNQDLGYGLTHSGEVIANYCVELLNVDLFKEPKYETSMMDNLVMEPERVSIIKALAGSYMRQNSLGQTSKRERWQADPVPGKGNGQIFLLHGRPGVGKTFTAGKFKNLFSSTDSSLQIDLECVANFTSRPLMLLTSSDIGTDPEEVEEALSKKFRTAAKWGAVLLIDEADVFMEKREPSDLQRNSLVAGKVPHQLIKLYPYRFLPIRLSACPRILRWNSLSHDKSRWPLR
jgi:SpoVK/Ycf46/Vps4 family AAA+-type ATPase